MRVMSAISIMLMLMIHDVADAYADAYADEDHNDGCDEQCC